MDRFVHIIVRHKKTVVAAFIAAVVICLLLIPFVRTNYDMVDYLPPSAQSTEAVRIMSDEFSTDLPNANVMVKDVTLPQALDCKEALENIEGVESVMWLDDVVDIAVPLETQDASLTDTYWHQGEGAMGSALYQVTVADGAETATVKAIRALVDIYGAGGAVSGEAADTAQMQDGSVSEVLNAVIIIVPIIVILLILSTTSWIEPLLFFAAIGVSIVLNMGTNIVFGEVSFLTYSVSPILQLAVSLDYAIFLLHEFGRQRMLTDDVTEAMARAMRKSMSTVAASALTTLFGFVALAFMQFQIGADLGLNLVKGIVFSFISVMLFLPALTLIVWRGIDKTGHRPFMPSFAHVNSVLEKIRIPATIIVVLLVVPAFLGQAHLTFTYQNNSPDPETRTGADLIAIEQEFGQNNAVAVLVPRGDVAKELALSEELEGLDNVKSVMSYARSVGAEVPQEFLDTSVTEQFCSDDWARIIAYVDTDVESAEAFATVEEIEQTAAKYYDESYAAGQSANLYDMAQVVSVDNTVVTLIAVIAIFLVLVGTFRSLALPIILLFSIEAGIWINLAIPYFMGEKLNFMGYLVVNTVQLGATIDYAILLTTRYMAHRKETTAREAAHLALGESFRSVLVSAAILATAGFALAATSSLSAVSTLGILLGRGALFSLALVSCVLPGLLVLFDKFIRKTTYRAGFFDGAPKTASLEKESDHV